MDRIYVPIHIGTAIGHLIRTATYLRLHPDAHYFVPIPRRHLDVAKRFLPSAVTILPREESVSVNSSDGKLDVDGFLAVLKRDCLDIQMIKPDSLLGDPGIRASIIGLKYKLPWQAIIHGCYLDHETILEADKLAGERASFITEVWGLIHRQLDVLAQIGTNQTVMNWGELRKQGTLLIPEFPGQTVRVGSKIKLIPTLENDYSYDNGQPVQVLITTSSGLKQSPPLQILEALLNRFDNIAIVGVTEGPLNDQVKYFGDKYSIMSLVNKDTIAITHGGYGTLGLLVGKVKRLLVLPQDIDQLCNTMIATNAGAETLGLESLCSIFSKKRGFQRLPLWPEIEWFENWLDLTKPKANAVAHY